MAKRRKEIMVFLVSAVAVVVVAIMVYVSTTPVLGATPSDGCMTCHMDAEVMDTMYELPEEEGGGGG
ncbi:MAG: hypothetical protein ACQES4_01860 [Bacillota bacterium]